MHNLTNQQLGNNIRKWRNLRGYQQQNFADVIGIAKSSLSKIENGSQEAKIGLLQKIAACLKIKVTQLFTDPSELLPPPPIMTYNPGN
jgi:transcriptional regulator with XRE-family HTH domain